MIIRLIDINWLPFVKDPEKPCLSELKCVSSTGQRSQKELSICSRAETEQVADKARTKGFQQPSWVCLSPSRVAC